MSSKESIRGGTEGDSKVFKSSNGFKGYGGKILVAGEEGFSS